MAKPVRYTEAPEVVALLEVVAGVVRGHPIGNRIHIQSNLLRWRAGAAGVRPMSLRRTIAGALDCRYAPDKISRTRSVPVMTGPGFPLQHKIYFWPTATKTATRPK